MEKQNKVEQALNAYKAWEQQQINRNKQHLITLVDKKLFAAKYKTTVQEMEQLEQKINV